MLEHERARLRPWNDTDCESIDQVDQITIPDSH